MQAGRLRFRVQVQQPVEERNAVGELEVTWAVLKTIWASIDPFRGAERFSVEQVKTGVDVTITTRTDAVKNVTNKMRFVYRSRIFDIDSSANWQTRGIFTEIYCKEAQ